MRAVVVAVLACACHRAAPIATCADDLTGVYEVDPGTTAAGTATEREPRRSRSGPRWNLLDTRVRGRRALEAYPLFDDTVEPPPGLEIAPRVIDLRPAERGLAGTVTRRFMRGSQRCDAKATVRVTACTDNVLELVLADPVPPVAFEPCTWGQAASSRRERWRRK